MILQHSYTSYANGLFFLKRVSRFNLFSQTLFKHFEKQINGFKFSKHVSAAYIPPPSLVNANRVKQIKKLAIVRESEIILAGSVSQVFQENIQCLFGSPL